MEQPDLRDRGIRHRDIIPPAELNKLSALVLGTGAIGRQVAIQLAAIGVPRLALIDPQNVEVENLAAQGFFEADLGAPKVAAVNGLVKAINSEVSTITCVEDYKKDHIENTKAMSGRMAVFCCVDSIEVRKTIWSDFIALIHKTNEDALFVDGRMRAEVARVLAVSGIEGRDYYPESLFSAGDAEPGSCTAKTTIYCANIVAGMMVGQLTRWLRGRPLDQDVLFNIVTSEITKNLETAQVAGLAD